MYQKRRWRTRVYHLRDKLIVYLYGYGFATPLQGVSSLCVYVLLHGENMAMPNTDLFSRVYFNISYVWLSVWQIQNPDI